MRFRDLDLDYETALHGVQSAIKYELQQRYPNGIPVERFTEVIKHLRTGIDANKAEQAGLAGLLIEKKVFTVEEYAEWMRLSVNEELARYKEHLRKEYGLPANVDFR